MDVKLTKLEAELLVRAINKGGPYKDLSAMYLTPAEKAGCKRLVKKGLMQNIMDTFFRVNDVGLERAKRIE